MDKVKFKKTAKGIAKDIFLAFAVVTIIMLAIFAYCGIWPPMVVVESGSMMHSETTSYIGVIDTGDMVFVKKVSAEKIVTYVEGEETGYSTYSGFGDVIIYRPNGQTRYADGARVVPIIHRAVLWLEINATQTTHERDYFNYTFDIPSMNRYGVTGTIPLYNYGYRYDNYTLSLDGILGMYAAKNVVPHSGFITKGDHNLGFDQSGYEPVLPEWIIGKAVGELPWFGLIKLKVTGADTSNVPGNSWTSLIITITIIILIPILIDLLGPRISRWRKGRKPEEPKDDVVEAPIEEQASDEPSGQQVPDIDLPREETGENDPNVN